MSKRAKIRYLAIGLAFAYSIARFGVVKVTLSSYGVNAWTFLVIDIISDVFYIIGIEQLIFAIRYRKPFIKTLAWGAVTAISFAAPYLYLFTGSHELPLAFAVGIGVVVALLTLQAALSLSRQLKRAKTG